MSKSSSTSQRRFAITVGLGLAFGFANAVLMRTEGASVLSSPLAWAVVTDRFVIGILVGLAGAYLKHPIFGFPIPPALRGGCLGAFASLPLALALMSVSASGNPDWVLSWSILLSGVATGIVADLLGTRFGGQGEKLLK